MQAYFLEMHSGYVLALEERMSSRASILEGEVGSKDLSLADCIRLLL